jgi:hypothetical protein
LSTYVQFRLEYVQIQSRYGSRHVDLDELSAGVDRRNREFGGYSGIPESVSNRS